MFEKDVLQTSEKDTLLVSRKSETRTVRQRVRQKKMRQQTSRKDKNILERHSKEKKYNIQIERNTDSF